MRALTLTVSVAFCPAATVTDGAVTPTAKSETGGGVEPGRSVVREAAVDREDLAADEVRIPRGEEHHRAEQILGRLRALDRLVPDCRRRAL